MFNTEGWCGGLSFVVVTKQISRPTGRHGNSVKQTDWNSPIFEVHPGLAWVKIQPAAVKEDSRFEVFTVSEATNSAFDGHDFAIESLGYRVGDFQEAVVDHAGESFLDGAGDFLERSQVGTDDPCEPINTLSVRDANSVGYDAVYDELNRATSQTDTTGVITSQSYDREGNVRTQVDGKGNSTQTSFDALGRRKTVTDRRGAVTTYGYTPGGQVSALTDAENQVTLYDYSARGEKIRETYPDHVSGAAVGTAGYGIVEFSYDPAGRIRMKTDQQGDTCTFTYNLAGQLLSRP